MPAMDSFRNLKINIREILKSDFIGFHKESNDPQFVVDDINNYQY